MAMSPQAVVKMAKLIVLVLGILIFLGIAFLIYGLVSLASGGKDDQPNLFSQNAQSFLDSQAKPSFVLPKDAPIFDIDLGLRSSEVAIPTLMGDGLVLFSIESAGQQRRRFVLYAIDGARLIGTFHE